jgi:hypothetical protein
MSAEDESLPPEGLSEEVARKWDPERLMKMLVKRAGKGEALDHNLRQRYEGRFGVDLGHVRLFTGEFAEEFAKQHQANAVTIGGTGMILMGGHADMSPIGASGEALLAHELTHVAQAERGMHFDRNSAPLATEQNEAEAEAVEAEVHAQASGNTAHTAHEQRLKAQKDEKELLEQVKHRVMDMFAEAGRAHWARNGIDPRRP